MYKDRVDVRLANLNVAKLVGRSQSDVECCPRSF
jgi:hypothetical protein